MQTICVETTLPTSADKVWGAMQHPASLTYVCGALIGIPALKGRTEAMREGECGRGWLLLFHVLPLSHHTIHLVEVDPEHRRLRSAEHGGVLRAWNHTLEVEPLTETTCRYRDTVEIDAGGLTGFVAFGARGLYRYRQRRWHRLVGKHLLVGGPAYECEVPDEPARASR